MQSLAGSKMSKGLSQYPVNSPLLDSNGNFNMPWMKYLKAIGDDMLTANTSRYLQIKTIEPVTNKVKSVDGPIRYTISGAVLHGIYSNPNKTADETVALPAPSLSPFTLGSQTIGVGVTSVVIPANEKLVQFWYFVN